MTSSCWRLPSPPVVSTPPSWPGGALVLAGLLLARGASFWPWALPWASRRDALGAVRGFYRPVLGGVHDPLRPPAGAVLRFANQAVALVCGIFGSFVGLMALLFPCGYSGASPGGITACLSGADGMDEATRWTAFFGGGRSPWIWPSCACGRPSFSLWDGLCSSERRYEAWYCAVSGRS